MLALSSLYEIINKWGVSYGCRKGDQEQEKYPQLP